MPNGPWVGFGISTMPYLKVKTNLDVSKQDADRFLENASTRISAALGKPEDYFMGSVEPKTPMIFGGKHQPAACLELYSMGFNESQTKSLSDLISEIVHKEWRIPTERVYIKFGDVEKNMWGWSRGTF